MMDLLLEASRGWKATRLLAFWVKCGWVRVSKTPSHKVLIRVVAHRNIQATKEEMLELRQEASDLQEYSNAKINRLTRYLGVLSDKARKLG